jgi:hypothetical protein
VFGEAVCADGYRDTKQTYPSSQVNGRESPFTFRHLTWVSTPGLFFNTLDSIHCVGAAVN